jgi:hypothetical protein
MATRQAKARCLVREPDAGRHPANLAVPVKPGAFVTEFGKGVPWDGAKDDDVTLMIIGEGPLTTTRVDAAK